MKYSVFQSQGFVVHSRLKLKLTIHSLYFMSEFGHGSYTLEVKDRLIICCPRGGFNEKGIRSLRSDILDLAKNLKSWVLLETPQDKAGLTPEAASELAVSYQVFYENGCKAIALEVGFTFGSLFDRPPFSELPIPVYTGKDPQTLIHQACQHLLK